MPLRDDDTIKEVTRMLKRVDYPRHIMEYLGRRGYTGDRAEAILAEARQKLADKRFRYLSSRNRAIWVLSMGLTMLVFLYTFIVIPHTEWRHQRLLVCLTATVLVSFGLIYSILYHKSWTRERLKDNDAPSMSLLAIVLFLVPGVVIYFTFAIRIDLVEEAMLERANRDATAIIVSLDKTVMIGKWGKQHKTYAVKVKFTTAEGEESVATENISEWEYDNMKEGEQVLIVYSEEDPTIIDLLNSKEDMQRLKGTEERSLTPSDLLTLLDLSPEEIGSRLENISYGWEADSRTHAWKHRYNLQRLRWYPDSISFFTTEMVIFTYIEPLKEYGIHRKDTDETSNPFIERSMEFESEKYSVQILRRPINNGPGYLTIIKNK